MLRKTLIILLFLSCLLVVQAGVVVESNAKYNFQKSAVQAIMQRVNATDWGVQNTSLGIWQPQSKASNSTLSALSNSSVSSRSLLLSSNAFSQNAISASQSVGYNSIVGINNNVSNSTDIVGESARALSTPFSSSIQKIPGDPYDPGIIPPPATPIPDGVGVLLVLAFGFLLFRIKRML